MNAQKSQKRIKRIFAVLFVCVFGYFVLGETLLPADALGNAGKVQQYSGEWKRVLEDGRSIPQQIPGRCEAERDEVFTVETVIPKTMQQDTYLCFRSAKQNMEIYVDGELRLEYSTKDTRWFGKTSAVAYIFLEVHPEDAGKTLQWKMQTDSSYSGIFYTVYVGSQMEIWQYLFKQYGLELIAAFLMILLSVISIIGSRALRLFFHRRVSLEYLGWGIFIAGVWLVANSVFRQLIFPNMSVINDIAFYMVMLLPFPYLIYMNEIQKGRYQKGYLIVEVIAIATFVVCSGLHIVKWYDFADTIAYMAIVCMITIFFMAATIIIDIWKGFIKDYIFVAVGIFCAFIAAFVQIVVYFQRIIVFNGVTLTIGLFFLLFFAIVNTIHEIIHIDIQKQQAVLASEAKGRFLANMSHEIRTPINAVLGMDAMILRESTESQIKEYALDIQNAGQGLLALINDILDLSKIESGKMEIIPLEYDLSSLLHDVVNMISMKAEDKELSNCMWMKNCRPDLWVMMSGFARF